MGNTGSRYLAALCSGIFLIAAAPFDFAGVQANTEAAAADGKALCAGKPVDVCAQTSVTDFKRLKDAWLSQSTTSQQRDQMAASIQKLTAEGRTDWPKAAADYFTWRAANPVMGMAGGPVYLGNKPVRTTCTTNSRSYYGYFAGSSSSTTTCVTN